MNLRALTLSCVCPRGRVHGHLAVFSVLAHRPHRPPRRRGASLTHRQPCSRALCTQAHGMPLVEQAPSSRSRPWAWEPVQESAFLSVEKLCDRAVPAVLDAFCEQTELVCGCGSSEGAALGLTRVLSGSSRPPVHFQADLSCFQIVPFQCVLFSVRNEMDKAVSDRAVSTARSHTDFGELAHVLPVDRFPFRNVTCEGKTQLRLARAVWKSQCLVPRCLFSFLYLQREHPDQK